MINHGWKSLKIVNDSMVCLAMHELLKKRVKNADLLDKFSPWKLYFVLEKSLNSLWNLFVWSFTILKCMCDVTHNTFNFILKDTFWFPISDSFIHLKQKQCNREAKISKSTFCFFFLYFTMVVSLQNHKITTKQGAAVVTST